MAETEAAGTAEFGERMIRMLNEAALSLMVSVGHRTGLFDVMAAMPAATSAEIAAAAGLDERYVREWLAAMTHRQDRRSRRRDGYLLAARRSRGLVGPGGGRSEVTPLARPQVHLSNAARRGMSIRCSCARGRACLRTVRGRGRRAATST